MRWALARTLPFDDHLFVALTALGSASCAHAAELCLPSALPLPFLIATLRNCLVATLWSSTVPASGSTFPVTMPTVSARGRTAPAPVCFQL
ncbi:BQ2448_2434 [Microbotryum intermedium]|uniref:BQ2448_2434 protein n=1 Tax=Microbotryum intermedium TaxID=269621 RepID=A0A238FBZ2_9BASI|nr:BQ2448_2434 [Microbotryum intermedium]